MPGIDADICRAAFDCERVDVRVGRRRVTREVALCSRGCCLEAEGAKCKGAARSHTPERRASGLGRSRELCLHTATIAIPCGRQYVHIAAMAMQYECWMIGCKGGGCQVENVERQNHVRAR